ncbi:MAG TPA: hypothetical protein VH877_30055 [Polyangia bacterium]|jgi:hypothetical protein|nr:hypothetical protein [Polyangia bacterium]
MNEASPLTRFRPLPLQLGDEETLLDEAHERLAACAARSVVVLPEFLAWTIAGSAQAYRELAIMAQAHRLTLVTTLNLGPQLTEDLPGRQPEHRHNAVTIFTRFGSVHVPQAKLTPQGFEQSPDLLGPGIGVAPYTRLNLVEFDLGETLLKVRFLVCSDLWLLTRVEPPALGCDLLVVLGNFARGAEVEARNLLVKARRAGVARATLLVNAHHVPKDETRQPLALSAADLATDGAAEALPEWPDRAALLDHFRVLDDDAADGFVAMVEAPAREGRIAVPRSCAEVAPVFGTYPLTIAV